MTTYEFRPARREKASLLIGLAGATGTGKTKSALLLAEGLAGPGGKIAFVDTEARRALHYAGQHAFDHCDLPPPFTPERYADAIQAADKAGYAVIVIDSLSHEFAGEGGIQDWADRIESGVPKEGVRNPRSWIAADWEVQPVKSPGNWSEPKQAHKRMVSRLLQCRAHLVICMRAEEKMKLVKETDEQTGRIRTKVIPADERPVLERWQPICEKTFPFELTASLLLLPSAPGVPLAIKLQDQHRHAFPEGQRIGRAAGEALAAWARGEDAAPPAGSQQQQPAWTVPAEPAAIPVPLLADGSDSDWKEWGRRMTLVLKASLTAEILEAWWAANAAPLETARAKSAQLGAHLDKVRKERLAAVAKAAA